MKKTTICLSLILLLTSLSGCGHRREILNQIESEKAAESIADAQERETNVIGITPPETGATHPADSGSSETTIPDDPTGLPNTDGYRLTAGIKLGDTGYYEGMTAEELKANFQAGGANSTFPDFYNTPTGMMIRVDGYLNRYYHKLTGNVTHACPDPLCDHSQCIWKDAWTVVYSNENYIYFTYGEVAERIARCDLERNHVETINFDVSNSTLHHVDGNRLYISNLDYQNGTAAKWCYGVLDWETGTFTKLSNIDNDHVGILAATADTLWYRVGFNPHGPVYKCDINFQNSTQVFEDISGEIDILSCNGEYMILAIDKEPFYLYNIRTEERTDIHGIISYYAFKPQFKGKYAYYIRKITPEEYMGTEWEAYYTYEIPHPEVSDRMYKCINMDAGRVYRMDLETMQEELVMELSYNGIPVKVEEIGVDGNVVFVKYLTYEDYNNHFNPDYMGGPKKDNIDATESDRYLYVDMNNGTVNLFDPYTIG